MFTPSPVYMSSSSAPMTAVTVESGVYIELYFLPAGTRGATTIGLDPLTMRLTLV